MIRVDGTLIRVTLIRVPSNQSSYLLNVIKLRKTEAADATFILILYKVSFQINKIMRPLLLSFNKIKHTKARYQYILSFIMIPAMLISLSLDVYV